MENSNLQIFKKTVVSHESDVIFIQPLCDFFGIDGQHQSKFIKKDPVLSIQSGKKTDSFLFGANGYRYAQFGIK